MTTWRVKYHVVFEIDREKEASSIPSLFIDGKQFIKRHDEMTIDEPDIHTEEQALEYLEDLFTNSDDHIVDLDDIPFGNINSETLEIDEIVQVTGNGE